MKRDAKNAWGLGREEPSPDHAHLIFGSILFRATSPFSESLAKALAS